MSDNIKFWSDMDPLTTVREDDKLMIGKEGKGTAHSANVGSLPFMKTNDMVKNSVNSLQWNPILVDAIKTSGSPLANGVTAIYTNKAWNITYEDITNVYGNQTIIVIERETGIIHILGTNGSDTAIEYLDLQTMYNYNNGSINYDKITAFITVDYINPLSLNNKQTAVTYDIANKRWIYQKVENNIGENFLLNTVNNFVVYALYEGSFYLCEPDGDYNQINITQIEDELKDIIFLSKESIGTYTLDKFKEISYAVTTHTSLITSELSKINIGDKVAVPYRIEGLENNIGYSMGKVQSINTQQKTIVTNGLGYVVSNRITGTEGKKASITIGETTTARVGASASVENIGTHTQAVYKFTIPQGTAGKEGEKGEKGDTGEKGDDGKTPVITIGNVNTVDNGTQAKVSISGEVTDLKLNFDIPKGEDGKPGTQGGQGVQGDKGQDGQTPAVTVGTVEKGTQANATKSGTDTEVILNFTLPQGEQGESGTAGLKGTKGEKGNNGKPVTITIGEVTVGTVGSNPIISKNLERGTDTDVVLDFTLPRGAQGAQGLKGDRGDRGPQGYPQTGYYDIGGYCGTPKDFFSIVASSLGELENISFTDWYNFEEEYSMHIPRRGYIHYDCASTERYMAERGNLSSLDLFAFLRDKYGLYVPMSYECYYCTAEIIIRPFYLNFQVDVNFRCPQIEHNPLYHQQASDILITFHVHGYDREFDPTLLSTGASYYNPDIQELFITPELPQIQ